MVVDRSKKAKTEDDNAEQREGELLAPLKELKAIQKKLKKINKEVTEEVMYVEQRYSELRKPIYEERNEIIKSIPGFWRTAFISHSGLAKQLTKEDREIFIHFSSLEVKNIEDELGYSITFSFEPNPYFQDSKLTKTFLFPREGSTKITATPIKWMQGVRVNRFDKKRTKRSSSAEDSFFAWFADAQVEDNSEYEFCDEIAVMIKDELWRNPISYIKESKADDAEDDQDDDADEGDQDDQDDQDDDADEGDQDDQDDDADEGDQDDDADEGDQDDQDDQDVDNEEEDV